MSTFSLSRQAAKEIPDPGPSEVPPVKEPLPTPPPTEVPFTPDPPDPAPPREVPTPTEPPEPTPPAAEAWSETMASIESPVALAIKQ